MARTAEGYRNTTARTTPRRLARPPQPGRGRAGWRELSLIPVAAAAAILGATAGVGGACAPTPAPLSCHGDLTPASFQETVERQQGRFLCVGAQQSAPQTTLYFDGSGHLLRDVGGGAEVHAGTYRYDGSSLVLEDDSGWRRTAREATTGHGLLLRFTVGHDDTLADCFAISLAGPCGVVGRYACEGLAVPGDTLTYTLDLAADYGVLVAERSHSGTAYDRGVYLFEDPEAEGALTIVLPRGRFAALPDPTAATLEPTALTVDVGALRPSHPLRCERVLDGSSPAP